MESVLFTVTGPDRPGVTADCSVRLHATGAEVQDAEQIVISQLVLCLLLAMPAGGRNEVAASLAAAAASSDSTSGSIPTRR